MFTEVSDLEACIKDYTDAIFQPCDSIADGQTKLLIFSRKIAEMFAAGDLFSDVESLPHRARKACGRTPVPQPPSLLPSPVAESSRAAGKRRAVDTLERSPQRQSRLSCPGDGWYVVHKAALPGVYYGAKAVKMASPEPGGFFCAANEKEAHKCFLELTVNAALLFVKDD